MRKHIILLILFVAITSLQARRRRRPKVVAFNLSTEKRQKMVDLHNEVRSRVNPPATNMLKMRYDQGLEEKALSYVKMCNLNKDLPWVICYMKSSFLEKLSLSVACTVLSLEHIKILVMWFVSNIYVNRNEIVIEANVEFINFVSVILTKMC